MSYANITHQGEGSLTRFQASTLPKHLADDESNLILVKENVKHTNGGESIDSLRIFGNLTGNCPPAHTCCGCVELLIDKSLLLSALLILCYE